MFSWKFHYRIPSPYHVRKSSGQIGATCCVPDKYRTSHSSLNIFSTIGNSNLRYNNTVHWNITISFPFPEVLDIYDWNAPVLYADIPSFPLSFLKQAMLSLHVPGHFLQLCISNSLCKSWGRDQSILNFTFPAYKHMLFLFTFSEAKVSPTTLPFSWIQTCRVDLKFLWSVGQVITKCTCPANQARVSDGTVSGSGQR